MIILCPIMIGSFAIGLPFGIKGVALSLSIALLCTLPWLLRLAFRNTQLTLTRLSKALLPPMGLSLTGVLFSEIVIRLLNPQSVVLQLLVIALTFLVTYSASLLIPAMREEFAGFWKLAVELRSSRKVT
jgi:hypothetical protein